MSQENVEVVWRAFEWLRTGRIDAWAERLSGDVEHRAIEGALGKRGPMHGREEMVNYMRDWFERFDGFKVQPLDAADAGDDEVVMIVRFGGRDKLTGVEIEQTMGIVYTVGDGKLARGREYATPEEALEAAGLQE